jgi:type II secretory pathway pseudopilin PulG
MKAIAIILLLVVATAGQAQKSLNVLDWKAETTLNNYLVQQMHLQYDQRRKNFARALLSAKNMQEYTQRCRKNYLALLGDMPFTDTTSPGHKRHRNSG